MDIEPLDADQWVTAIRKLEERRHRAPAGELERLLRHAYHLQQLAPRPLRGLIRSDLDEKAYERLLERGAYERAAAALVGQPLSYSTRSDGDQVEAAVRLPGDTAPVTVRAADLASALLGAWLGCLMTLEGLPMAEPERAHARPARAPQSKSTVH